MFALIDLLSVIAGAKIHVVVIMVISLNNTFIYLLFNTEQPESISNW